MGDYVEENGESGGEYEVRCGMVMAKVANDPDVTEGHGSGSLRNESMTQSGWWQSLHGNKGSTVKNCIARNPPTTDGACARSWLHQNLIWMP